MKLNKFKLWLFSILIVVTHIVNAADTTSKPKTNSAIETNTGIYKNVNEDGVVEFSDQSGSNSKKIKLKSRNTFKAADKKITPTVIKEQGPAVTSNVVKYTNISISSPTVDQGIRSNDGRLSVTLSISPSLNVAAGDQIELFLDGRSQGKKQSTQFSLTDVYRGQHKIQAKIIDKRGKVLETSKSIKFFILKYSALLKPNRKKAVTPPAGNPS